MPDTICFFYHPHVEYETQPDAQLGLGLLSLATYAKDLGAEVSVINAQDVPITKALKMIPNCKYLMLYGCMIDQDIIELIVMYLKHRDLPVPLVCIGGPIAKSIKKVNWPIMVLDGQGEDFIWTLCREDGWRPGHFHLPPLKLDINDYPFPRRDLIEGKMGGSIFKHRKIDESTTILTSRGCKYQCAFCTSGNEEFHESYSIERIEKEIEHCLSLGINNMRVSDDNILGSRLHKLCDIFKEAKIYWRASIRVKPNEVEIYEYMKESGCEELSFGVESGDQDVLDLLNKKSKVEDNTKAVINANKARIKTVRVLMMMGTPGETEQTLTRNKNWVAHAYPDSVSLKMFVPYPGTEIHENPGQYSCSIKMQDVNNSSYRPDNTEPKANISLWESNHDIEFNFGKMKKFIEDMGMENKG